MKTTIALVLALSLAGCNSSNTTARPAGSPAEAAKALNEESLATLGASVRALSFLFESQPGSYLLKEPLTHDGSWHYLVELERAKYANLVEVEGPDGEIYIQIEPTNKGRAVLRSLLGP